MGVEQTYSLFPSNNRRTASALSESDNGSEAIINRALAKSPSLESTTAEGAASTLTFDRLRRVFSVSLVQPLVQRESGVAVSSGRLSVATLPPCLCKAGVEGSSPFVSTALAGRNSQRRQRFSCARGAYNQFVVDALVAFGRAAAYSAIHCRKSFSKSARIGDVEPFHSLFKSEPIRKVTST